MPESQNNHMAQRPREPQDALMVQPPMLLWQNGVYQRPTHQWETQPGQISPSVPDPYRQFESENRKLVYSLILSFIPLNGDQFPRNFSSINLMKILAMSWHATNPTHILKSWLKLLVLSIIEPVETRGNPSILSNYILS
jgi:hypothetical protein